MPRGGARENAGRKPGTPNKASAARIEAIEASGITPLDYMLTTLRDEDAEPRVRFEAAKAAAPYCHNRLSAIEHTGKDGGPIEITSKAQRDAAVSAALRADA